jgi:hypothetical protein
MIKIISLLINFSKSIDPRNDYESLCHDAYLRCRDRIEINGYQGQDFLNYTRVAIMNLYKSNYRINTKQQKVDVDDTDYCQAIETKLQQIEQENEIQKQIHQRNIFLNSMVFEYLEKYCSPRDTMIFRTYFLLKHKKAKL